MYPIISLELGFDVSLILDCQGNGGPLKSQRLIGLLVPVRRKSHLAG